ncbi:sensor histidine kinase [Candidatus Microgenomates bacterium]|nr:MAG: sensor histidine kinase [Candidatus Microgenomates bacterium]
MFQSARLKLTTWYLLIIMLISVSFSFGIYRVVDLELDRVERIQRLRIQHRDTGRIRIVPSPSDFNENRFYLDKDLVNETKERFIIILGMINLAILGTSGIAGYFLAGRTLKPIKRMLDEQNNFITNISHELRTPLTSLKSEIEVNLRDKSLSLIKAKKLLMSNLEEVNNLQNLSDRLIELTRYQENGNDLKTSELNLSLVIAEVIKKIANLAKNKNIIIINKVKKQIIQANQQSLIELFTIFLDNAIKYSPKSSKVFLESEKTNENIVIKITDQGIGIKENEITHLFNRFYRADKSRTKQKITGYGLGLSIAKEIINSYKGSITVKSKIGEGTTFYIKLPLKKT